MVFNHLVIFLARSLGIFVARLVLECGTWPVVERVWGSYGFGKVLKQKLE